MLTLKSAFCKGLLQGGNEIGISHFDAHIKEFRQLLKRTRYGFLVWNNDYTIMKEQ